MTGDLPDNTQKINSGINRRKITLVVLTLLTVLFLMRIFGYWFYQINKKGGNSINQENNSLPIKVTISKSYDVEKAKDGFKKKNFKNDEDFIRETVKYPTALISLKDEELIGVRCSPEYRLSGGEYSYYNEKNEIIKLVDNTLISFLDKTNRSLPERLNFKKELVKQKIERIRKCETEDGKNIVFYWLPKYQDNGVNEFSYKGTAFIGYLSADQTLKFPVNIDVDVIYAGCREPLALTKKGTLYYICEGGDGGYLKETIYTINLDFGEYNNFYSCEFKGGFGFFSSCDCKLFERELESKLYKNEVVGISFLYPSSLSLIHEDKQLQFTNGTTYKETKFQEVKSSSPTSTGDSQNNESETWFEIIISIFSNSQNLPLREFLQKTYSFAGVGGKPVFEEIKNDLQPVNIFNQTGLLYKGNMFFGESTCKVYFFAYKDKVYVFLLFPRSSQGGAGNGYTKDQEEIFNEIIENIKFL